MTNSKSKILKIGSLLLALLLLLTTFVSCNVDETEETETQGLVEEAATDPVPHYDWGGRNFNILALNNPNEPNFELVGELGGDIMSDTVYHRNNWIEEYYNVTITVDDSYTEDADGLEALKNVILADDYDYDLAFLARNYMGNAITSGYMNDLDAVSYIDFSNEWYNSDTLETMRVGGRLFHMVSDFSLVDKARINTLYYNRDLGSENQHPDIVQMVRDKKWTIEQMLIYTKSDPGGDGKMDLDDSWGLVAAGKEFPISFWSGLNNKIVAFDEEENWSVEVANEHSMNSIAELRKLFSEDLSFCGDKFGNYDDPHDTFLDGRAFFYASSLSSIESLGENAQFSYTPLPYPMYDVEQGRYYTTNDNTYGATFGIPTCAADADFSAFMVEVLSWKSSDTTLTTYYNTVCKVKSSYDEVCAEMVDVVVDSLVFDFGLVYGSQINLKTKILLESINTTKDISGLYKGVKTSTENKIENLFNSIEALD